MKRLLLSLLLSATSCAAFALTPTEIKSLQMGNQLRWKDDQQTITIHIDRIQTIKDTDGSMWYEVSGQDSAGQSYSWLLDPNEEGDIAIVRKQMKLKESGLTKKEIKQIEKADAGQVVFEGDSYQYETDASDDATLQASANGPQTAIHYATFTSVNHPDISLIVFEQEEQNRLLQTESFDLPDLQLIAP